MKQLVCEMCGGTDLIKQDGVFVCQSCGCKYSVEEAKKMMVEGSVEVSGTVKLDQSSNIENYLSLIENALEVSDVETGLLYCNKIFEIEPSNYRAWAYKSKMIAWNSSLKEDKILEATQAIRKTIELTPDEEKEEVADDLYLAVEKPILALIEHAACSNASLGSEIHNVFTKWQDLILQEKSLSVATLDHALRECEKIAPNQKASYSTLGDLVPSLNREYNIYTAWKIFNNKEAYSVTFRRLIEKRRKEAIMNTWNKKPEVKALLDKELKRLIDLEKDALAYEWAQEKPFITSQRKRIQDLFEAPISQCDIEKKISFLDDTDWERERQSYRERDRKDYDDRLHKKEIFLGQKQAQETIIVNNKKMFGEEAKRRKEAQNELERIEKELAKYHDL